MKIFLDFDNTIVDTNDSLCKYLSQVYHKDISTKDIIKYDLSNVIKLSIEELSNIFSSDLLFNNLQPYPGVRYVLHELKKSNLFEIYLVSNSSEESTKQKLKWLKETNLDKYFDGKIFLNINKPFDKSLINMKDSIFVDDHKFNHETSNATYKYSYVKHPDVKATWYPWDNKDVTLFSSWGKDIVDEFIKLASLDLNK